MQDPSESVVPGGWTQFRPLEKSDEKVFALALEGLVGVKYAPLAVATQVVAGTNYDFVCMATPATRKPMPFLASVCVFAPLEDRPHVTSMCPVKAPIT